MKSKIKKLHKFYDPVFGVRVIVRLETFLGRKAGTSNVGEKNGLRYYLLKLIKIDRGLLSHECIHLVSSIFNERNFPLYLNYIQNQEVFAYYHDYWVETIWKVIKNW
jgi:hypothetical protein